MAVAVFSGALNIVVYLGLGLLRPETVGIRWYAVVTGGAIGWIGHKAVSYGYGEKFHWTMPFKFVIGVGAGIVVYKGASSLLSWVFSLLPWNTWYIVIHVLTMVIGFLFFQQWNLRVTFRKTKLPDGPAVIHVELSDE